MIDIFYNGILVAIVLVWVIGLRVKRFGRLIALLKSWGPALTVSLWAVFVIFLAWYALNFDHFVEIHDIDDAVDAAVVNTKDGVNTYEEYVVPRFKGKYAVGVDWTMGPYNYMPLDLIVYVGAEAVFGGLGSPEWFVVANLVFAGVAMILLRDIMRSPWMAYIPIAGVVMLFYSMDNASLTLLLMTSSVYVLHRFRWHPEALALVMMGLAVLTKVYAAIPFLVLLIFLLQTSVSTRNWRRLSETVLAAGVAAAIAVLVMLPFGISNVLDAAVFFHTSAESRSGTSAGGTILSELLLGSEYFAVIGAGVTLLAVVAGMWARSLNDRVLLASVTFLLIAVKSSLAPLTVAGLFLALRLRELADERRASASASNPSDAPSTKGSARASAADR